MGHPGAVRIRFRNPTREEHLDGPITVHALLDRFDLNRESVLVIVDGALVPGDARIDAEADVEIRPVISGGAFTTGTAR